VADALEGGQREAQALQAHLDDGSGSTLLFVTVGSSAWGGFGRGVETLGSLAGLLCFTLDSGSLGSVGLTLAKGFCLGSVYGGVLNSFHTLCLLTF